MPLPEKKKTERMCCACGERREKKELLRIVLTPEGKIEPDESGRKNGRGVYLCRNTECLAMARKKKAISRSLKTEVPESVYGKLAEVYQQQ